MRLSGGARRLLGVVGVGMIAVVAVTGCVQQPLPATPAIVDTPPPHPPYVAPSPTPVPSLSADQTNGLESTPWQAVGVVERDITIRYVAGGGCSAFEGVRVVQAAASVEVWTAVRTDHGAQACAAYLAIGATTIHLAAPLGTRALLHAPVSDDWKLYIDNF